MEKEKEVTSLEISPVRIMLEFVVAAESRKGAETDGRGEEDLCAGVDPHLRDEHTTNQTS